MVTELPGRTDKAFEALYDEHYRRMYRFFYCRTGSDHAAAEDLAQSFFVKVWLGLPRYEDRGLPPAAWLYRMARNHLADHYREQRRRAVSEPLDNVVDPIDGRAGREFEHCEDAVVLAEAMAALRPKQRRLLTLRFLKELGTGEVAAALGIRTGTVRVQQLRALRALRQQLQAG